MDILVTGAAGRVGTAILEHLHDGDEYNITGLDTIDHPNYDIEIADVTDYEEIRPTFEGQDAVIHLARPKSNGELSPFSQNLAWTQTFEDNLRGITNVFHAASDARATDFIYSSSHHIVGMYELSNTPDIYEPDFDLQLDHTTAPRPDSLYAITKVFGEAFGRLAVDAHDIRFYSLRLGNLRAAEWDHPYADAEKGVENGDFVRESNEYEENVKRLKASWLSRRDAARLFDRCLQDKSVDYGVFYGVSDNRRSWFDIEHAREVLGYDPQDASDDWDEPPA